MITNSNGHANNFKIGKFDFKFSFRFVFCVQIKTFVHRGYNICKQFPNYKVDFYGIGPGPSGTEQLGCCSQMALFVRDDFLELTSQNSVDIEAKDACHYDSQLPVVETVAKGTQIYSKKRITSEPLNEHIGEFLAHDEAMMEDVIVDLTTTHISTEVYRLIRSCVYPRNVDDRSREEKIFDEACFHLSRYMNLDDDHYDPDTNTISVPVKRIFDSVYKYTCDINEFR